MTKRLAICGMLFLWCRYFLEPTGWLFYELHHKSGIDGLYWGYSAFRFADYWLASEQLKTPVSVAFGVGLFFLLSLVTYLRRRKADVHEQGRPT